MGGIVATEGRHRGDDSTELGLRVAGRRIGGDLLAQTLDVPNAVRHLSLAELDLQRRPRLAAPLGAADFDCAEGGEQPLQALDDETPVLGCPRTGVSCTP